MNSNKFFSIILVIEKDLYLSYSSFNSIFCQKNSSIETIIITNTDEEIFFKRLSFSGSKIDKIIYCDKKDNLPSMMNRGIRESSGRLIQFLKPGSFFISDYTLKWVKEMYAKDSADVIFYAYLTKENEPPAVALYDFDSTNLKLGKLPTHLDSIFFTREIFESVGMFSTRYSSSSHFDFLCRVFKNKNIKPFSYLRVCVDCIYKKKSPIELIKNNWEKFKIINKYFGIYKGFHFLLLVKFADVVSFVKIELRKMFVNPE